MSVTARDTVKCMTVIRVSITDRNTVKCMAVTRVSITARDTVKCMAVTHTVRRGQTLKSGPTAWQASFEACSVFGALRSS